MLLSNDPDQTMTCPSTLGNAQGQDVLLLLHQGHIANKDIFGQIFFFIPLSCHSNNQLHVK